MGAARSAWIFHTSNSRRALLCSSLQLSLLTKLDAERGCWWSFREYAGSEDMPINKMLFRPLTWKLTRYLRVRSIIDAPQ